MSELFYQDKKRNASLHIRGPPSFGFLKNITILKNRMEETKLQKWYEYVNYYKRKTEDGNFCYFIVIDGVKVEVNKTIYTEYATASRKMKYIELDIKCSRVLKDKNGMTVLDENRQPIFLPEREAPLDRLIDEYNWDFMSDELPIDDVAILNVETMRLYKCLALLSADEREIINALFFNGYSEREYSHICGVPRTTISSRKNKILNKIKKLLEK